MDNAPLVMEFQVNGTATKCTLSFDVDGQTLLVDTDKHTYRMRPEGEGWRFYEADIPSDLKAEEVAISDVVREHEI